MVRDRNDATRATDAGEELTGRLSLEGRYLDAAVVHALTEYVLASRDEDDAEPPDAELVDASAPKSPSAASSGKRRGRPPKVRTDAPAPTAAPGVEVVRVDPPSLPLPLAAEPAAAPPPPPPAEPAGEPEVVHFRPGEGFAWFCGATGGAWQPAWVRVTCPACREKRAATLDGALHQ